MADVEPNPTRPDPGVPEPGIWTGRRPDLVIRDEEPIDDARQRFVVFLQLNAEGPLVEKIVEADWFTIDHKHGLVNFWVDSERDGYFRERDVIGVMSIIDDE